MCQGLSHFSGFLHHFVLAKLTSNSTRFNTMLNLPLVLLSNVYYINALHSMLLGGSLKPIKLL